VPQTWCTMNVVRSALSRIAAAGVVSQFDTRVKFIAENVVTMAQAI